MNVHKSQAETKASERMQKGSCTLGQTIRYSTSSQLHAKVSRDKPEMKVNKKDIRNYSSTLKVVLRQVRVPIPQSRILQREYRKRELAIPFSFWSVFILTRCCDYVTMQ